MAHTGSIVAGACSHGCITLQRYHFFSLSFINTYIHAVSFSLFLSASRARLIVFFQCYVWSGICVIQECFCVGCSCFVCFLLCLLVFYVRLGVLVPTVCRNWWRRAKMTLSKACVSYQTRRLYVLSSLLLCLWLSFFLFLSFFFICLSLSPSVSLSLFCFSFLVCASVYP